jgi:large subunit ribosomal protein L7/L12
MAKMSADQLLDAFKEMTLIELSDFVKQFEETFDVTAAAPAAMMMAAPGAPAAAEPEEEPTEFDVVLENDGGKKIQVIKVVRELTGLGLKEAKDLVEAPQGRRQKVNEENADKAEKARGRGRQGHPQVVRAVSAGPSSGRAGADRFWRSPHGGRSQPGHHLLTKRTYRRVGKSDGECGDAG